MPTSDDTISTRIRAEIDDNGKIESTRVFNLLRSEGVLPEELTRAQFHGRFVLPELRSRKKSTRTTAPSRARKSAAGRKSKRASASAPAAQKPTRAPRTPVPASDASATTTTVRGILLRFAQDVAGAKNRSELVRTLVGVDDYVTEVLRATAS